MTTFVLFFVSRINLNLNLKNKLRQEMKKRVDCITQILYNVESK